MVKGSSGGAGLIVVLLSDGVETDIAVLFGVYCVYNWYFLDGELIYLALELCTDHCWFWHYTHNQSHIFTVCTFLVSDLNNYLFVLEESLEF